MDKFEFGHFYKFIVSLGLGLFILALAIPYFFLKETFNLNLDTKTFENLSPSIKEIFTIKLSIVTFFLKTIPFICLIIFIIGLAFFILGLLGWYNRQKKIDSKDDLEIEKLRKEISNMTPSEIAIKGTTEVISENVSTKKLDYKPLIENYFKVEKHINNLLSIGLNSTHTVKPNQKIIYNGQSKVYDSIIIPVFKSKPDILVEIKYNIKGYTSSYFKNILNYIESSYKIYTKTNTDNAKYYIIAVYPDSIMKKDNIDRYINYFNHAKSSTDIQAEVIFISENELWKSTPESFIKLFHKSDI